MLTNRREGPQLETERGRSGKGVGDVDQFLAARVVLYPLRDKRQVWVAPLLDNRADLVDLPARLTGHLILP
jgi:hypothetical protein